MMAKIPLHLETFDISEHKFEINWRNRGARGGASIMPPQFNFFHFPTLFSKILSKIVFTPAPDPPPSTFAVIDLPSRLGIPGSATVRLNVNSKHSWNAIVQVISVM